MNERSYENKAGMVKFPDKSIVSHRDFEKKQVISSV